jgi:hypothetical protein
MSNFLNNANKNWSVVAGQIQNQAANGVVYIKESAFQIPTGASNDRPSVGEAGMIRYSTNDNVIEYYASDTASWNPVSLPSPIISNYSPVDVKENEINNYSIDGSNFSIAGVSVRLIGNNGAGTIIAPTLATVSSTNLINIQFDLSGTQALFDVSNELPFACKVTNNNSGFSSTITNAITIFNTGPFFIEPDSQTVPFQTFAVGDPSAFFTVVAEDTDDHYPLSFSITNGTVGGITDVSLVDPSGAIVKVPDGSRTSTVAGSYAFTLQVTDVSSVTNSSIFELQLAEPTISNVNPDSVSLLGFPTSIVITGTNFVIDTSISFINGSTIDNGSTVFSSSSQLNSTVTFTSSGNYDISVNNGPAFSKLFTNLLFVYTYEDITMTGNLSTGFNIYYLDSNNNRVGTVGEAGLGGFVVYEWYDTTGDPPPSGSPVGGTGGTTLSGTFTLPFTASNTDYLIIAGGGGGGGNSLDGGGGGAGGYRTSFDSSTYGGSAKSGGGADPQTTINFLSGTAYNLTIGKGGIPTSTSANTPTANMIGVNSTLGYNGGTISCTGGGVGGDTVANGLTGGNGGSGGGGAGAGGTNNNARGTGLSGQGFNGGVGNDDGGGGGGAGGAGENATVSPKTLGRGGLGLTSYISGISFAQGGGGMANGESTSGGGRGDLYGGGSKSGSNNGTRGASGTGGGGAGNQQGGTSGAGGSGYCAIRILITG